MKRSYLTAGAIAAAVAVWLATGLIGREDPTVPAEAGDERAEQAPAVRVIDLVAEPHVRRLSLFGRTEADRSVDVRSETAGRVDEKVVEKGRVVEKGDVLVRLDMEDRVAKLREAEALVEQWEAMSRASRSLAKSGYAAELKSAEDRAALAAARAQLEQIKLDIERTALAAPFAGVVNDIMVDEGDYLDRFEPVATVVDLDPIKMVAEVTEQDAGRVALGSEAGIRLVTGESVVGRVTYVGRTAQPETRTFKVEVEVENPDLSIAEGITAEVGLPLDETLAHLVSPAILTLDDGGRVGVKLVDDDGLVVFRPVKVIDDTSEGMWVAGLPPRARVITVGQEFVRQGQRVRAVSDRELATGIGESS